MIQQTSLTWKGLHPEIDITLSVKNQIILLRPKRNGVEKQAFNEEQKDLSLSLNL